MKIINEYNKSYRNDDVLWLCERKDIPQKLFFKGEFKHRGLHYGLPHKSNYKFWKDNDIVDMSKFHMVEHMYNKNSRWVDDLNNYSGDLPQFLMINRAFMTIRASKPSRTIRYRYQEIKKIPKLVIIDECHSSMSNETYQLLMYLKHRGAKIQGFSATPYRSGRSRTSISIDMLDSNDGLTENDIETKENEKRLLNIFHKPGNITKLNVMSFFNLKDAIEEGIVVEPVFHWYELNKTTRIQPTDIDPTERESERTTVDPTHILCILNQVIKKCRYRKCIAWCGTIAGAENWFKIFREQKLQHAT